MKNIPLTVLIITLSVVLRSSVNIDGDSKEDVILDTTYSNLPILQKMKIPIQES